MDPPPLAPDESLELGLERELPALRAFLGRLVGRSGGARGDAEDLAQEAMARALRYRASFDRARPLRPWLRRAALRVLLDQRARERDAPCAVVDSQECVADSRAGPRELIARREEVERLLERLAPLERELLVRFHRGGESVDEIARALALPAGTVRSHLHRARRKLAEGGREPEDER